MSVDFEAKITENEPDVASKLSDAIREFAAALTDRERAVAGPLIRDILRVATGGRHTGARIQPPELRLLKSYLGDLPQTAFDGSSDFSLPVERIMPRHADAGRCVFPSLWDLIGSERRPNRALRVCIVTPDIDGPIRNGGIGTAYRHVAEFLRKNGHHVTILYALGRYCEQGTIEHWIAHYADRGVTLAPLPEPEIPSASGRLTSALARPRAVYEWLKDQTFDLVHTTEWKGSAYVALSAKRLGLAFEDTLFLVKASSPTLWGMIGDGRPMAHIDTLITTYVERKCIEYADVVISPTRHMLRWMMRHGYDLPAGRCFVHPNITPTHGSAVSTALPARVPVSEIVFFGRFEPRKGIHIFLRALDHLGEKLRGAKVTFLGKKSPKFEFDNELAKRQDGWPCDVSVIDDKDSVAAAAYLRQPGRLAVVPSLLDNAPFTVLECLMDRIPLVASDRGGGPELICGEDRPDVLCDGIPSELAAKIEAALRDGALVARPSFDPAGNLDAWREAHLAFAEPAMRERFGGREAHRTWNGAPPLVRSADDRPLVSVCIAHFNRPTLLALAIDSIRQQSYRNVEIVVVDDGSSTPDALAYLDQLEQDLMSANAGRVVRQPNRYLGAARNTGLRNATGEFILLMDDDNLAKPQEIETFLGAADYSGADILCCYSDTFTGAGGPTDGAAHHERLTPLGDAVSLGLFYNCFGDSNCFVRREVFAALGGFTEDYGIGLDDHELFARAILRGFKLQVVPEALYWYRISFARLRDRHFDRRSGEMRVMNAYLDNVPLCLHEALRVAQAQRSLARPIDLAEERDDGAGTGTRAPMPLWQLPFRRLTQNIAARRDRLVIRSSGLFDADYYLKANPDVAKAGVDPLTHFLQNGAREGRKPSRNFDLALYLDAHPEATAGGMNPLVHYIREKK